MNDFRCGVSLLALPLFILFALVPHCTTRCIAALIRKQWSASLLALCAVVLPFGALFVMPDLLGSIWMGWEVDPTLKGAIVAQAMPGVMDSASFGLLFGMFCWPWIARLEER